MLRDHGALIAIQRDAGLVEGFFGMPQLVVEFCDAAFEYGAEVARDQSSTDGCKKKKEGKIQLIIDYIW